MLRHRIVRWFAGFALAWIAVSALLWSAARLGFGSDERSLPAWRAIPGNIAYLSLAPGRLAMRHQLPRSASYVVSSAIAGAAWAGTLAGLYALFRPGRGDAGERTDPSRRVFLARLGAGGTALSATGGLVKAAIVDPMDLRVERCQIPIRGLPPGFDGLRIAHLSDWHAGSRVPRELLMRATRLALAEKPDLVALTGDFVHAKGGQLEVLRAALAPFFEPGAVRLGVYGVLGNHDYYAGAERVRAALRGMGVAMIDNDRVVLGSAGGDLCIAGLADPWMDTPVQERALGGVSEETPRVVLCHQPDVAEHFGWRYAGAPRTDLMLSGHTHGGQVRLPIWGTPVVPSRFGQRYAGGVVEGPHFPVVVSRGIGMSVLPIRFNVPPEVGIVTLRRI